MLILGILSCGHSSQHCREFLLDPLYGYHKSLLLDIATSFISERYEVVSKCAGQEPLSSLPEAVAPVVVAAVIFIPSRRLVPRLLLLHAGFGIFPLVDCEIPLKLIKPRHVQFANVPLH
jgi:hypothetical protein